MYIKHSISNVEKGLKFSSKLGNTYILYFGG